VVDDDPQSGEDRLIARHFRPLARARGAFALTDDAAILEPPAGHDVVLKADAIIAGVHFFADDPAAAVAAKALRVNLSDLAAKGAAPAGFLLSLALPDTLGEDWLADFARGLGADADRYGCPLLGGDTDRIAGPAVISIAAFGLVPHGAMIKRSGARPGDAVVVTGTIGDSALGLRLKREPGLAARWRLNAVMVEHLVQRYLLPQPRNAVAAALRAHASAAMDVSDGLVGDLTKLAGVSGVGAEIDAARVPLSDAARAALAAEPALTETALTGGDDYEILATMAPGQVASFTSTAAAAGVAATEIGRITAGADARFLDQAGRALTFARHSYSHF